MNKNHVILVNENDEAIGTMRKMDAHRKALLHRAVSVFICNSKGQWLMQQRTKEKYHSGGLWSNTCCTHPFPGEENLTSAKRRLKEEMGMQTDLTEIFDFIYKAKLDNELTEHELDHVFFSISDQKPKLNPAEVVNYKYISFDELDSDVRQNPQNYSEWFKKIYKRVNEQIKTHIR